MPAAAGAGSDWIVSPFAFVITMRPAADACAGGSEFVTVRPVMDSADPWKPGVPTGPTLAGCVDSDKLTKAAEPTPTNPRG